MCFCGDNLVMALIPIGDKHNSPKVITNHPKVNILKMSFRLDLQKFSIIKYPKPPAKNKKAKPNLIMVLGSIFSFASHNQTIPTKAANTITKMNLLNYSRHSDLIVHPQWCCSNYLPQTNLANLHFAQKRPKRR